MLENAGFAECETLWCDDDEYTGYVVVGKKQSLS